MRSGKSSGARLRDVRGLDEGERLDIFVFYKPPNVAAPVFGVNHVLQLALIAAADPEEDA